ncbi:hypothetical protein HDU96_009823 [Phlyctochytrium bullatum]|nr:hypothetical protein HDU96_009823 [Phlyctochytrium bullatum]
MFEFAEEFASKDFDLKAWLNKVLSDEAAASSMPSDDASDPPGVPPAVDGAAYAETLDANFIIEDADGSSTTSQRTSSTQQPTALNSPTLATPATPTASTAASHAIGLSPLDVHASNFEHQLHLFCQELSARLDHLADDAVKSVPRLLHDIASISRDAASLASLIVSVKKELDDPRAATAPRRDSLTSPTTPKTLQMPPPPLKPASLASTSDAFEALVELDRVRTRMEMTRQRLKETESWSTLTAELDAIFAAGDLERAGERLMEASRSLMLLEGTPEQEERKALLGKLRNRLEADLGPRLVAAIHSNDFEAGRKFWGLFEQIGRKGEFEAFYYKTKRTGALKKWVEGMEKLLTKSPSDALLAYVDVLSVFYKEVLQTLKGELEWCGKIFPNPRSAAIKLIHQTFSALKPTLQASLESLIGYDPATEKGVLSRSNSDLSTVSVDGRLPTRFLPVIVRCYLITIDWGKEVEKSILAKLPLVSAQAETGIVRRKTSGLLAGGDAGDEADGEGLAIAGGTGAPSLDSSWGTPIFDPFLTFQQSYGALESAYLSQCLPDALRSLDAVVEAHFPRGPEPRTADHTTAVLNEAIRTLTDSVPKVFSYAELAILRCLDFTAGFGFPGLQDALNAYLSDALDALASSVLQVREEMGLEEEGLSISASGSSTPTGSRKRQTSAKSVVKVMAEDGQMEWLRFQYGIRVVGIVRSFAIKVRNLEDSIIRSLAIVRPFIQTASNANLTAMTAGGEDETEAFPPAIGEALSRSDLFVEDSSLDIAKSVADADRLQPSYQKKSLLRAWRDPCLAAISALQVSSLNNLKLHQLLEITQDAAVAGSPLSPTPGKPVARGAASVKDVPPLLLFAPVLPSLRAVVQSSQRVIFDSLFASVDRLFATVPKLKEWAEADAAASQTPALPRFSLSPLPYITRVGESLLTLPQRIEMHGGDDGVLAFSMRSLPFLEESDFQTLAADGDGQAGGDADAPAEQQEEDIIHLWITSISRAATASYVAAVLKIQGTAGAGLGREAARQMATDMAYLVKVFEALDVTTPASLAIALAVMEVPVPAAGKGDTDVEEEKKEGIRTAMKAAATAALETYPSEKEEKFSGLVERLVALRGFK